MPICLPTCGHGRGNRAPCAGRSICASFAPLGVYIYAVGGESCTTRHPLLRSARLAARHSGFALGYPLATLGPHFVRRLPDRDRAWHLWSSSSRSGAPRPRSRSPRRLSRRLHGVTRRHASSAEYRLLALRRVPPRIRRTEPSRVAQLATRHAAPLPHLMLNPFKPPQQILTDI